MELFSISDEQEAEDSTKLRTEKRTMHPAFLPISFPVTHLPKGRKQKSLPQPLFYALHLSPDRKPTALVLQVQDEYCYAYERRREFWVVRHTWSLRRLIVVELDERKPSEMTLVFPNKTLDPADPLKKKTFDVPDLPGFLLALRGKLIECDIDLELDAARGLWVK